MKGRMVALVGVALWAVLAAVMARAEGPQGFTITPIETDLSTGLYNKVTLGSDGFPVARYVNSNDGLKVLHCANSACTTNTVTVVDATFSGYGGVASGADGLPVLTTHEAGLALIHCGNVTCTAGNTTNLVDGLATGFTDGSVGILPDGHPVISYNTGLVLKVAHCGNAACSAGNTINTVDSDASANTDTSITIGTDGLPVMSYHDNANTALKVAHCGDETCSAGNIATTVDNAAAVGQYPSMVVPPDGRPVVAYFDDTNNALKVARCGNADCTAGNVVTTVDGSGSAGNWGKSIRIGTDGLPIISYHDVPFASVAHCGNADCSAGNLLTPVEDVGPGDVQRASSLVIGTEGLPVITYTNAGFIKVAHCENLLCSAGKAPVGGIAELPDVAAAPLEASDSSGPSAGAVAGIAGAVAGVAALGGVAWYARKRRGT